MLSLKHICFFVLIFVNPCLASTIYVDCNAPGPIHDGSSWENAYKYLQDALEDANSSGLNNGLSWVDAYNDLQEALAFAEQEPEVEEIHVAQGVYKPTSDGDIEKSFILISGLTIKGGFAGFGSLDPNYRNPNLYPTILSGDLNGDDEPLPYPLDYGFENREDNSIHVIRGEYLSQTTVVDGFVITGSFGESIHLTYSSTRIMNCIVSENVAESGSAVYTYSGNPLFENCQFYRNQAWHINMGGAVLLRAGNPVIINCVFNENYPTGLNVDEANASIQDCTFTSQYTGFLSEGLSTVRNCSFIENYHGIVASRASCTTIVESVFYKNLLQAIENNGTYIEVDKCNFIDDHHWPGDLSHLERDGGAIFSEGGKIIIQRSFFKGNLARRFGGGIYLAFSDSSIIANCVFIDNSSEKGGAILTFGANASIINCNIIKNSASEIGGGIRVEPTGSAEPYKVLVANNILWKNSDGSGESESAQISDEYPNLFYNCIQNWSGSLGGKGNFDGDPLFAYSQGINNLDLHLLPGSPCLDAGDNNSVPSDITDMDNDANYSEPIPFDLDGDTRFIDDSDVNDTGFGEPPIIDVGVYEGVKPVFLDGPRDVNIPEGNTAIFEISLAFEPEDLIEVNVEKISGDEDISIIQGNVLYFDANDYNEPQTVILFASEDIDNFNNSAEIKISAEGIIDAWITATEFDNENIIYVDVNAPGNNDGTCWYDAYTDLQDALNVVPEMPNVTEIWVGQGTYKPTDTTDRDAAFQLINGLTIKGGFYGVNGLDPNERDVELYQAILSGDLNGDDGPNFENYGDNSRSVVSGWYTDTNSVIDGFYIVGGSGGSFGGGGITHYRGGSTIINCTFRNNSAGAGAGISNYLDSYSIILNCKFYKNISSGGAGVCNKYNSYSVLENCIFIDNISSNKDAGILHNDDNCGMIITNCALLWNEGLGFVNRYLCNSDLINCSIIGNGGFGKPSAIHNSYSNIDIRNCIIWDNESAEIVAQISNHNGGTLSIEYSDIQDGQDCINMHSNSTLIWGDGNIDFEPNFVDITSINPEDRDFHLSIFSPCIDSGDPNDDYNLEPQPNGQRINLGFYGNTPEAAVTLDSDGDGYLNAQEVKWGLNPEKTDTDDDLLNDPYEVCYDGDCNNYNPFDTNSLTGTDLNAVSEDTDDDDVNDYDEIYIFGTNPLLADTDEDGLTDGQEIYDFNSNPLDEDTDNDTMPDKWEVDNDLDPNNAQDAEWDLDNDGLINKREFEEGCLANNPDTDGDKMTDGWEVEYSLNPLINDAWEDFDNDTVSNLGEFLRGTRPDDPLSIPDLFIFYVDDDAPNDPGPNDPCLSDPSEDGSLEHPFDAVEEAIAYLLTYPIFFEDRVVILDGCYQAVLPIQQNEEGFTLISANGPEECIIDCQSISNYGFDIYNNPGESVTEIIINGFNITNAQSSGINIDDGKVVVKNCILENNRNGIIAQNSVAFIKDSMIKSNTDNGISFSGDTVIERCIIFGNDRGLELGEENHLLRNCLIFSNFDKSLYLFNNSVTEMINTTVLGSVIPDSIYLDGPDISLSIINSIVWGSDECIYVSDPTSSVVVSYSDVQGGWPGIGNIDSDPEIFADEGILLRLLPDSNCINAGDPAFSDGTEIDLEGKPRIIYGRVDMGAIEFKYLEGDFNLTWNIDYNDLWIFTDYWLEEDCNQFNDCDGVDIDLSGAVDAIDYSYLAANWMSSLYNVSPRISTPIMHWKFDEGEGLTAYDDVNDLPALLNNMDEEDWVTGIEGLAVDLDGTDDYIGLPEGITANLTDFTIACWVKFDIIQTWQRIFDFGEGTDKYMFLAPLPLTLPSCRLRFAIKPPSAGEQTITTPILSLNTGQWRHVAVTLEGNTGRIYVDGFVVGINSNMTAKPASLGVTTQNYIGKSQYSWDPYLKGQIDDFRIYNYALTPEEVLSLFESYDLE